jgi:hypothetical protein
MPARSFPRLALLAAFAAELGCRVPNADDVTVVLSPDYDQFKGVAADGAPQTARVSRVLERRCATLDCHGQINRPLRIYGQYGLRLEQDGSFRPGVEPTSEAEYQANYASVIGLQPEVISLVAEGVESPTQSLLLLRKPLALERHKGGAVIESGDKTYACITSWLAGQVDFGACGAAAQ